MKSVERAIAQIERISITHPLGRVGSVGNSLIAITGLASNARLGDRVVVFSRDLTCPGEVVKIAAGMVEVLPEGDTQGIATGMMARLERPPAFAPDESWIGRVIDPDGKPLDGRQLPMGPSDRKLLNGPPPAAIRRPLGERLSTGYAVFDTVLPIARGQRLGLFAGSGVGKSTLLGGLARSVEADVIVIGLVGERGRELREFTDKVLGPEGMKRSVVIAATSDRAPQTRRRCAWAAMSVAEYFRNQGKQVLLLMDSITRFAEAHRELVVAAGEPSNLRGFPATTGPAIAALCERSGPGTQLQGDITAIYTVLVAGSDMDEPVADMLRGVLDGHVILDRTIAERGRYPAVDVLRSISRSLPDAASEAENILISQARAHLGVYDRSEMMIKAGLYTQGTDFAIDQSITVQPRLDKFITLSSQPDVASSFTALQAILP